jgi:hypothetical protein
MGEEDNKNVIVIDPARFEAICLAQTSPKLKQVMARVHNHPTAAHPGRDKTLRQL